MITRSWHIGFLALALLACTLGPTRGTLSSAPAHSDSALSPNIVGVWQPVTFITAPDARPGAAHPLMTDVGITLEIFTKSYYSHVAQATSTPRPPVPDSNVTLADVMAEWSPFSAQAGTYAIRGDTLIRHPIVAKNPKGMTPYDHQTFVRLRIQGDTMWQTSIGGSLGRGQTIRYVRLERD
jgi:hypothetical protein